MMHIALRITCLVAMNVVHSPVVSGTSPPTQPSHVTLLADTHNIGVQWEPPTDTYGIVRKYIVSWAILPSFADVPTRNIVDGDVQMSIIPVLGNVGRLYRIRVRAENDAGIGQYSAPKYVRIDCGEIMEIMPYTDMVVTSPGFNTRPLSPGLICKWSIKTSETFVLMLTFEKLSLTDVDLGGLDLDTKQQDTSCDQTFVNISGVGRVCQKSHIPTAFTSSCGEVDIILKTGSLAGGRGFSLITRSVPKLPGPPVNIGIKSNEHAISIAWQPPLEITLPLTAYHIRYKLIPVGSEMSVKVGAQMHRFIINSERFQGKVVRITITAMIGEEEGEMSRPLFARAPCIYHIHLLPGESANITSPNYPSTYPSGIVCTWDIRTYPGATFHVTYVDFRLEDTSFCSSDYVTFSSFPNREPVCARMTLPKSIYIYSANFTLTFVTDNKIQFQGFLIQTRSVVPMSPFTALPSSSSSTDLTTTSSTVARIKPVRPSHHTTSKSASSSRHLLETGLHSRPHQGLFSSPTQKKHTTNTANPVWLQNSTPLSTNATTVIVYHDGMTGTTPSKLMSSNSTPVQSFAPSASTNHDTTVGLHSEQTATTTTKTTTAIATEGTRTIRLLSSTLPSHDKVAMGTSQGSVTTTELGRHINDTSYSHHKAPGTYYPPHQTSDDVLVPVFVSVAVLLIGTLIGAFVVCRRRWHRQMKVNIERPERYRQTHIELFDIVPHLRAHRQTQLHTAHAPCSTKETRATTVFSRNTVNKNRRRKTRTKYDSFPSCHSKRIKVHKEVERAMKAFSFIEDKDSLEKHIRRKQRIRRTNSM